MESPESPSQSPASDGIHPDPPSDASNATDATAALIIGCGYVGQRLAQRRLAAGATVYATTRTPAQAHRMSRALPGARMMICDTTQALTLAALRPALEGAGTDGTDSVDSAGAAQLDVFHLVPPGRATQEHDPRAVMLDGTQHVMNLLQRPETAARIRRAIWVSSSAVYGDHQGRTIDTDTPAAPDTPRAQLIQEGEELWRSGGERFRVLRLAGIYGPSRIPGLQAVASGAPIVGNPEAPLNLIHVEDVAALLDRLAACENAAPVELGADGTPRPRLAYYTHLAERMNLPVPEVLSAEQAAVHLQLDDARRDRLSRTASKALVPTSTWQRTGWRPKHPDALDAIDDLLTEAAQSAGRSR